MSNTKKMPANRLEQKSLEKPILTSLLLLVIALFFKWIDTFVLRLDERLGEIILSKSLGFILVILFVWMAWHKLKDIGLHSKRIGQSLLIGASVTIIAFLIGYGIEYILAVQQAGDLHILFAAVDNKMSVTGGYLPQLLMGLVWGYMYFKTNSLWAPWISHLNTNSTLNLLHIDTLQGMDTGMMIRMPIFTILALLSIFAIRFLAEKLQMAEVKPWGDRR